MVAISVSMIVRNEAPLLPRALQSLEQVASVNEIVVLDTGSTDDTVAIALAHGARVHHDTWAQDFSLHRNRCLDLCNNDWVLILDGDEFIVDAGNLDALLAEPTHDAIAVQVQCVREETVFESLTSVRAFNRRIGRWKYPVHNQVVGVKTAAASTARFLAEYDTTAEETTAQRLKILLEHAATASSGDFHYPYFITKGYRTLRRSEQVLAWGRRCIDLAPTAPQAALVYCWMVEAHLYSGDFTGALAVLEEGLRAHPRFPDLRHLRMTLAVMDWHSTVTDPDPRYNTVPSASSHHVAGVGAASKSLGLPIEFDGSDQVV